MSTGDTPLPVEPRVVVRGGHRHSGADLRRALAGRGFVPALLAVFVVQAGACGYLLGRSYFFAEDFTFLQLYDGAELTWERLTAPIFGHLIPGFVVINKYFGEWFGANWAVASLVTVAIQLLGTLAFARLMHALHGRRWWLPLITACYGCSLVVINTSPWWGATVTIGTALAACVSVWGCAVRFAQTRRIRHLVALALMYCLALAVWEKSLMVCAYLGLFVLIVGVRQMRAGARARLREAWTLWPVWLVLAAISLADLAVYASGPYLEASGDPAGLPQTLEYLVRNLTEGLFPTWIGTIYPASLLPGPSWVTWVVATTSVLALIGWTSSRSRLALRAWLWFAVSVTISQLLVARGRLAIMGTDITAHNLRYELDATMLFVVAASVAIPAAVATRRLPSVAIPVIAALALVVAPLWARSVVAIADTSPGAASRAYFADVRSGPPRAYLDVPVPGWIVPQGMYPWNMLSSVLPVIAPAAEVVSDPTDAHLLNPDGSVSAVELTDLSAPVSKTVCLDPGEGPRRILTVDDLPAHEPTFLAFDYTAEPSTELSLQVGSDDGFVDLRGMATEPFRLSGSGALATIIVNVDWEATRAQVVGGGRVCLDNLRLVTPAGWADGITSAGY